MDNIENLETEVNLENIENGELYELIANSINFLTQNNNEDGQDYLSISIAEGSIPKTSAPIKKFVLESYKDLLKKNNSVRKMNNPLYRLIYSQINYDIAQPLLEYFEDERKCLTTLKKFLNSKMELPKASFTGIFTSTIIHIHNVNIEKINKIIDMSQNLKNSPFSVTLPASYTTPDNHEFINNIETTISKVLVKEQK